MLALGPAKKITIHLNEDTSSLNDFLSKEILLFLFESGVAGATVSRPESGFGSHHRMHEPKFGIDIDPHMPMRIEFIESEETVERLLPMLQELLTDGLIEVQDTRILKAAVGEKPRNRTGESTR